MNRTVKKVLNETKKELEASLYDFIMLPLAILMSVIFVLLIININLNFLNILLSSSIKEIYNLLYICFVIMLNFLSYIILKVIDGTNINIMDFFAGVFVLVLIISVGSLIFYFAGYFI